MSTEPTVGITGAQGFIGRGLVTELDREKRVKLRLFGRRASTTAGGLAVTRLDAEPASFAGIDTLVHLAGVTTSKPTDADLTATNVDLALDVARAAASAEVRRFVFFSSVHVHGKAITGPISPETPYGPENAYGRSKVAAEQALEAFCRGGEMELIILRPPMIYGPAAKGSFALLLKLVRTGIPLPFGAATAPRSFCSISNLVSATIAASTRASPPRLLFPADPEDFSTRDLVEAMKTASGTSSALLPVPNWIMRRLLLVAGRGEIYKSLFESLVIDRSHWRQWDWRPVETGAHGVRVAVLGSPEF